MGNTKGFSLVESLLSLAFSLIIILAGLELFGVSRDFFLRLRSGSEDRRAALAALDKLESDIGRAGRFLAVPVGLGLLDGLDAGEGGLKIEGAEEELALLRDIEPGQRRIEVVDASGIKIGREVVLGDGTGAQVFRVDAVEDDTFSIDPAAGAFYARETSRLFLLTRVEYALDAAAGIIRRKENGGGGQPLLESVRLFEASYDEGPNTAFARLALRTKEKKIYERHMFPKNMSRAFRK
ncbi:MAG: hypothetical protein FJY83_04110 [Candidatus Aminicenantes bacterium]|nr:hypothetical protein [Candidatus Aminicenantes bacterium]